MTRETAKEEKNKRRDFLIASKPLCRDVLGRSARWTYICLCLHRNSETDECFPSIDTIVEWTGLSKPTVIKAINELEEFELIRVYRGGRGRGDRHFYVLRDFELE